MRRRVFVDAWAWVALAVADDPNHARASQISSSIRSTGGLLVTSNFAVDEALTRIRYDASLQLALRLAETLAEVVADGHLEIVTVMPDIEAEALQWFARYADQVFSFTDCTSFVIMRRMGIAEAFTSDSHFAAAGFVPLASS